jgi:hypothetical protein
VPADARTNGELEHAAIAAGPVRAIERREPLLPALRTPGAVAAAGGFVAGAAVLATARALRTRRRLRKGRRGKAVGSRNVVASRSFLVDVHVLGR